MKNTVLLSLCLLSIPSVSMASVLPPPVETPALSSGEQIQSPKPYKAPQLIALSRKKIEARFAADVLSLEVTRGIGMVVNFAPLGDSISGVQISDPSTLVYKQMGAGAVFIKPIGKLNFEGNLSAASGRNLLTIVMGSGAIYQIELAIKSNTVQFSGIDIVPDGTLSPEALPPAVPDIPTTTAATPAVNNSPSETPGSAPLVAELDTPSAQIPPVSFFHPLIKTVESVTETSAAPKNPPVKPPSSEGEPDVVAKAQSTEAPKASLESVQLEREPKSSKNTKKEKRKAERRSEPKPSLAAEAEPTVTEVLPSQSQSELAVQSPASTPRTPIQLSHAIARGLPVAVSNKQIGSRSYTYYKSQSAIRVLRRGKAKTLEEAAQMSRTKLSTLTQLVKWGTAQ